MCTKTDCNMRAIFSKEKMSNIIHRISKIKGQSEPFLVQNYSIPWIIHSFIKIAQL